MLRPAGRGHGRAGNQPEGRGWARPPPCGQPSSPGPRGSPSSETPCASVSHRGELAAPETQASPGPRSRGSARGALACAPSSRPCLPRGMEGRPARALAWCRPNNGGSARLCPARPPPPASHKGLGISGDGDAPPGFVVEAGAASRASGVGVGGLCCHYFRDKIRRTERVQRRGRGSGWRPRLSPSEGWQCPQGGDRWGRT